MGISLQQFARLAAPNGSRAVHLDANRQGAHRSGRAVSWIRKQVSPHSRGLRQENQEATRAFISSLKQAYGDSIGQRIASQSGLDDRLARGKPLRERDISAAVQLGRQILSQRHANAALIDRYRQPMGSSSHRTLFQDPLDSAARRFLGEGPAAKAIVDRIDPTDLQDDVAARLELEGREGEEALTEELAAETADAMIKAALVNAACEHANAQLSLSSEGSPARQALREAFLNGELAMELFNADQIRPDMAANLNGRMSRAADAMIFEKLFRIEGGRVAGDASGGSGGSIALSTGELRTIADGVMGDFASLRINFQEALAQRPAADAAWRTRMLGLRSDSKD